MAIGCLVGLEGRRSHPDQMSVMGIDNITAAQFVSPPLTTIAIPLHDLGAVAMQRLVDLHQGEAQPDEIVTMPHHLVTRDSTGPAPNS
jgi:DNA-binding LacI/PurR family transcriptional regulator